jgi:hypothetical protein
MLLLRARAKQKEMFVLHSVFLAFQKIRKHGCVCDRVMLTPPQEDAGIARTAGNQSTLLCVVCVGGSCVVGEYVTRQQLQISRGVCVAATAANQPTVLPTQTQTRAP